MLRDLLLAIALLVTGVARAEVATTAERVTTTIEFPALTNPKLDDRQTPLKLHLPDGDGPFPVVVVSHGAGGNWNSNFAQARHLASHGYAVVCLEHTGSNTKRMLSGGFAIGKAMAKMTRDTDEVLDRPKDVSFAIDQVVEWNESHQTLRSKFDIQHIGVLGHSFGAYTTLVVCGARPALDWIQPKFEDGKGLGPDLLDKRVRCGVALSPQGPGEPFFLKESYESIRVPLLGISGDRDKQQNFKPIHRWHSFQYWPPRDRYFLWIDNATHLSFSDSTGSKRRHKPAASRRSSRHEDVQKISRAATLRFFDKYLRMRIGVTFSEEDLRSHMGGVVDEIELRRK